MNDYAQNIIDIKHLVDDIYNNLCRKEDVSNDIQNLISLTFELKYNVDFKK